MRVEGERVLRAAVALVAGMCLLVTQAARTGSAVLNAHPQPSFVSQSSSFQAKQGESIVLPCVINNQGPYVVVWKRQKRVLSARELIVVRDPRFTLQGGHNLRIDDVEPEDQSTYTCTLDTDPLSELTHRLEVLYGPVVASLPAGGVMVVKRGEPTQLRCEASGNPAPKVAWRKQLGLLPSSEERHEGRLYRIPHVSRQMAGVYECVADNGLGAPAVATVSLQVQYPPEVEVQKSAVYAGEGFDARLVCFVYANPVAEVRWVREGGELDPSRHTSSEDVVVGTRHVLTIRPVQMADFDTYSCQAFNSLGSASGRMTLSGVPERVRVTSSPMATAPDSYQLAWEVRSFSKVLEYKVAYRQSKLNLTLGQSSVWREVLVPPTGSEVVDGTLYRQSIPLAGLPPATVYDLYVQARNRHGWSAVSEMFHFSTLARGEALESRIFSGSPPRATPQRGGALLSCLPALLLSACRLGGAGA